MVVSGHPMSTLTVPDLDRLFGDDDLAWKCVESQFTPLLLEKMPLHDNKFIYLTENLFFFRKFYIHSTRL